MLHIRLTGEKATNWAGLIELILTDGWVSLQCLDGIIGKLSFPQAAMFGKFPRSQMRVLYKKLYRKYYVASLSDRGYSVFRRRFRILKELDPRITRPSPVFRTS